MSARQNYVDRMTAWSPVTPPVTKPRRRIRNRPEGSLQILIADYLHRACPNLVWWFVPNGGNLSKAQRAQFQKMGLRAGVSDLHFILPGGVLGVIELKRPGANLETALTDEQKLFQMQASIAGARIAVCDSLDDVQATLLAWGVVASRRVIL